MITPEPSVVSRRYFLFGALSLSATVPLWGCGGGTLRTPSLAATRSPLTPLIPANADLSGLLTVSPVSDGDRQTLQTVRSSASEADRARVGEQMRQTASVRWNERTRLEVAARKLAPPVAARVYALVSAAQHDAVLAAQNSRARLSSALSQRAPAGPGGVSGAYFADDASASGFASAEVLASLFPDGAQKFRADADTDANTRLLTGWLWPSDLAAAQVLAKQAARNVLAYADTDGSTLARGVKMPVPVGRGLWNGVNPVLPGWGQVKTWCVGDVATLRPPAPPSLDSDQYKAALAEVRQISDTRTDEQLRIAKFWADGGGTSTPPGHWNQIASDLIADAQQARPDEMDAARTLALVNVALADASVCCWDAKYTYWLMRPSQADPAITLPVGLPNFPSFTSGHSTFSGAASEVLAARFPSRAEQVRDRAREASVSRVYGGIHYRFDCETGLAGGQKIGQMVLAQLA